MEPSHSQNLGAAEECHSCESGWTMYLGSPTHDDDEDDDEEQEGEVEDRIKGCDAEDESDDSMASDASSGPSRRHRGDSKGSQLVKESEIAEKKVEKKGTEFMDHRGIKIEVEKVRKNNCVRKRK